MKRTLLIGAVIILILGYVERGQIRDWYSQITKPAVPSPMPYHSATPRPQASSTPAPSAVNLDIPFVSQAPKGVWDHDHEEFCEEASALMAVSYIRGDRSVTNPDIAELKLQQIKAYEMGAFGYFEDTTAAETAQIIRDYFKLSAVRVVPNPTVAQIKAWIGQGKAVLVPAAGRLLQNPYFQAPGPLYHMIVIKGYTLDGRFITNDPGTRHGADYIYDTSTVMNAMHDWNGGDVLDGAKVVIVVG